jgi:DNA repair protein RAD16
MTKLLTCQPTNQESDEEPLIISRKSKVPVKGAKFKKPPLPLRKPGSTLPPPRKASSNARMSIAALHSDDDSILSIHTSDGSDFDDGSDDDDMPLAHRRKSISSLSSLSSSGLSTPRSDTMQTLRTAAQVRAANRRATRRARPDLAARIANHFDRRKIARRLKLETAHPEIKTMWKDLGEVPIPETAIAEQPESITRRLKNFQLEGLSWMIRQERTKFKGGLLGDEMGMGKTIQAVSLIMSDYPAKDPTLVLVPPVALMQWSNEISDYTNGKLKVLVVHNTNAKSKNLTPKTIRSYNVVMMSYNSLESMFRKQEKGWSRGETITKEDSPIHAVKFHRLILDEAHSIKQRTTGVAKACFALKGKYKWCLSGTPVQNRIGEFFSLLRFLEVRPFADYFCERCSCAELHWTIDKDHMCTKCKHSASEHRSVFNEELLNPITGDSMILRSEAMDKLHMITARVMLRRLKKDHTSSMELPPKEIVIHNEFFGEIERDFSSSIMTNTARKFDTYVSQGVMLNNYANIFGLIMQMRQVANHPDLLLKKHSEGGQNILVCNICDEPAEEAIRSRCRHEFCRSCVKQFVAGCEGDGAEADCPRCHIPLSIDFDQPDIEQDEEQVKKSSIINRIKMENWTSSTKIEMLVYDLYKLRSKKQTLKSIVFSQFTSMLQLIEWRLRRAGFNTVMLDGSMTPIQRQRSIDYFMNNTDVEVFLVSLKAGGVALNLTEASRVFIVDP